MNSKVFYYMGNSLSVGVFASWVANIWAGPGRVHANTIIQPGVRSGTGAPVTLNWTRQTVKKYISHVTKENIFKSPESKFKVPGTNGASPPVYSLYLCICICCMLLLLLIRV